LSRFHPISLLPALPALFGGGLAWAQLEAAQPAAQPPAEAESPPPAALPAPPPPPLRPDPVGLSGSSKPPLRFDQSLDELVRQGVVTPGERSVVRGSTGALAPLDVGAFQQA